MAQVKNKCIIGDKVFMTVRYDRLYDPVSFGQHLSRRKVDTKLWYQTYKNAYIFPAKGVFTFERNYVDGTDLRRGMAFDFIDNNMVINSSNERVIYIGYLLNFWGHDITDCIKRMWFVNTDIYKKMISEGYKVCYITRNGEGASLWSQVHELFEILGLRIDEMVEIKSPTCFSEIVCPDESFYNDGVGGGGIRHYTKEYRETIDIIRNYAKQNIKETGIKKIYFLNKKYDRLSNHEDKIARYFQSKGYKVLRPELYSFKEQLNYLIQCEAFASSVSSASQNIMFLKENAEVILIPRGPMIEEYQVANDEMMEELNINYIDSSLSFLERYPKGWFYILSEELLGYFGDNIAGKGGYKKSLKGIEEYVRYNLCQDDVIYAQLTGAYYRRCLYYLNRYYSEKKKIWFHKAKILFGKVYYRLLIWYTRNSKRRRNVK